MISRETDNQSAENKMRVTLDGSDLLSPKEEEEEEAGLGESAKRRESPSETLSLIIYIMEIDDLILLLWDHP